MQKIRYGLIGCGRIAPNHIAAAIANDESIEIVAVCDIAPENMEIVLRAIPEEKRAKIHRYTEYPEMLSIETLELVAIATESGKHAQIGLDVIAAGCNIIVEKPIALSIRDADLLIMAAEANHVLVCACHQNRFNKSIMKIRSAVEENRFGGMLHGAAHIRWNRGEDYYSQAPWRGTWEQDGGALMNQCIHNIDLLRWMMGDDIDEVFAYTANLMHPYIATEDLGLALIKFKNGAYGFIEGTTNVYPKNLEETLYLFGRLGTVKAGGKSVNKIEEWSFADNEDDSNEVKAKYQENPPNVYGYGHTPLYSDVVDAIRNKRKPYVDGEAGKRALELVLAIYLSAKEGRPVKLPLCSMSTMEMKGSFI